MRQEKDKKKIEKKENLKHDDALKILQPLILTGKKGLLDMAVMKFMAEGRLKGEHLRDIYLRSLLFFEDNTKDVISSERGEEDGRKVIRGIVDEYRKEREKRERVERILDQMVEKVGLGKGDVKIEMDEEGAKRVRGEGVQGLEEGGKIYLDGERFDPDKKEDKVTLGHEIAHVVQMKRGLHPLKSRYTELEAERMGRSLVEGGIPPKPMAKIGGYKEAARQYTEDDPSESLEELLAGYAQTTIVEMLLREKNVRYVLYYRGNNREIADTRFVILELVAKIAQLERDRTVGLQTNAIQNNINKLIKYLDTELDVLKTGISSWQNIQTVKEIIRDKDYEKAAETILKKFETKILKEVSSDIKKELFPDGGYDQSDDLDTIMKIAKTVLILAALCNKVIEQEKTAKRLPIGEPDRYDLYTPKDVVYPAIKGLSPHPYYTSILEGGYFVLEPNTHIDPYTGNVVKPEGMTIHVVYLKDFLTKNPDHIQNPILRSKFIAVKRSIIRNMVPLASCLNLLMAYQKVKSSMKDQKKKAIEKNFYDLLVTIGIAFATGSFVGLAVGGCIAVVKGLHREYIYKGAIEDLDKKMNVLNNKCIQAQDEIIRAVERNYYKNSDKEEHGE